MPHRGTTQECIVCVRKTGQPGRNSAASSPNRAFWRGNAPCALTRRRRIKNKYCTWLWATLRGAPRVVLCCKTRVTYKHSQVSRGGILKVASECCGTESTHSKLRLRLRGKRGADFDSNLTQKHVLKVEKMEESCETVSLGVLYGYSDNVWPLVSSYSATCSCFQPPCVLMKCACVGGSGCCTMTSI